MGKENALSYPDAAMREVLPERLRQFSSFEPLSERCLGALVAVAHLREFAPLTPVLRAGIESHRLFVVLSGRAKMYRHTAKGTTALLALFGPGEIFGTVAALGGRPSDTTVEAIERCECLEIRGEDLIGVLRSEPELLGEVLPLLSAPLVECRNCLVEAVGSRVEVRFAHLFLKLAEELGEGGNGKAVAASGTRVPVRLSRQDLADMTGTTLESAIRLMSRWKKEGVVETTRQGFVVHDPDTLRSLLGD